MIRFDLDDLPQDFDKATLRLYPVKHTGKLNQIGIRLVRDNRWQEDVITYALSSRKRSDRLTSWQPRADDWNEVDLTEVIRAHGKISGKVTLHLQALGTFKGKEHPPSVVFASSEHENAELRPVLLVEQSHSATD